MSKLTDVRCPKCDEDLRPEFDGEDTWVRCDSCEFDALYRSCPGDFTEEILNKKKQERTEP